MIDSCILVKKRRNIVKGLGEKSITRDLSTKLNTLLNESLHQILIVITKDQLMRSIIE
jgi:hypothetical protein